jgi:hypothetical protein
MADLTTPDTSTTTGIQVELTPNRLWIERPRLRPTRGAGR